MWIPAGLSALFFLDKNTGLLFICTSGIWHLLTEGWEHKLGLLGLLVDWWKDRIVSEGNNSKLSFYPQNARQAGLRAFPTL